MPRIDKYGNVIYSQAEYQHEVMMGNTFKGFVEGIGYMLSEVVITRHTINTSGTHFVNAMHSIQYLSPPPSAQNRQLTNKDIEQSIKDYVTQNGLYRDPIDKRSYPMKQGSSVDVKINGDNVTITYKSSSDPRNVEIITKQIGLEDLKSIASVDGGFTNNNLNSIQLRDGSYTSEHLETARSLRKVSSWAFSAEQMITPAVRAMERKMRQSAIKGVASPSKSPVWIEKSIFGKKIDSRVVLSPIKKIPGSISVNSQGLRTVSKVLKYGGNALGIAGLTFSGLDMYENGPNRNNVTQFVMGVVAMIPQTRIIGTIYFMGNIPIKKVTGKNIEDVVDDYTNQVIGNTMIQQINQSPPAGVYIWTNSGLSRY